MRAEADIFIPDGLPLAEATRRITRLGIGAHCDDLEFMAFHGITACHASDLEWFGGVTCTDSAGSSRTGPYAGYTDAEMTAVRLEEQRAAARIGRYGLMIQLGHTSRAVQSAASPLADELLEILRECRPDVVYTHNLADKHQTHVCVALAALRALRELPKERRPREVWGCEVWRGLDWMPDNEKGLHDVSGHDALAVSLNAVFESQILGGKRYDLATLDRRRSNATFLDARAADKSEMLCYAMNLSPLVEDASLDIIDYVRGCIRRFEEEVLGTLARGLQPPEG